MIKFMFPARLKVIYAPEPECEDNTYQKPVTWNLGTLIKILFCVAHYLVSLFKIHSGYSWA